MINIRIDDRHAYVELEVFGSYQLDRMGELLDAMRGLSERHGRFSELEIHHGKPDNRWAAMMKISSLGKTPDDLAFMQKMRRYALVSDNPPLIYRLFSAFARNGTMEMRIFPMHERDHARQWIEGTADDYAPAASAR